jgi:membrane associated rhomboid family serine protease
MPRARILTIQVLMAIVIFLVVLAFVVYRATTPEEHQRFASAAQAAGFRWLQRFLHRTPSEDAFDTALRERQKHAFATLAVVTFNVAAFVAMTPGRGGSEQALLQWGASFGPRTTNGEWWRLVTAIAVEPTMVAFVVHTAAMLYVGRIVERLIGVRAFIGAYLTAGVLANMWDLSVQPIAVTSGGAGALLGLFGIVVGTWGRGLVRPHPEAIPSAVIRRIAPVAAVLFIHALVSGELMASSAVVAFSAGVCASLVLMHEPEGVPVWRTRTYLLASGWALAMVLAIANRSITDVRPVIEALGPLEARTSEAYEAARRRFQNGRESATNLVEIIEKTILPELREEQARIAALDGVPREHEGLVRDAAEYLKHRTRSWELRAEGLRGMSGPAKRTGSKVDKTAPPAVAETREQGQARHTENLRLMGKAETEERAALETLQRLTTASS